MTLPVFTDEDFLGGLQELLPTGPVWPRDSDATQTQALLPLVQGYTRNSQHAADLLADAFPIAPVELLPEWEETLGLPDPCAGDEPTLQARQQQVAARFIASGGQSVAYYIAVAKALGYDITITQYTPARFGQPLGNPLAGPDWAFAWLVTAPGFTIKYFTLGRDTLGEPFSSWTNTILQCELQRIAPAHTILIFDYTSEVA